MKGEYPMIISWASMFLVIAIIAGIFGFAGIAGTSAWIAQVLFVLCLVLFLVSSLKGRRPPIT
jgi:uncharacterized membrane protein YtjA (UPF0391 family)